MIVLIDGLVPESQAERIRKLSPKIRLVLLPKFGEPLPKDLLKDAEVIYTTKAHFSPVDAPKLRWVQTNTAATNPQSQSGIWQSLVPMCNVVGAYSPAVAECAFAMLLALTRRIPLAVKSQMKHHWPEDYMPWAGEELCGATMGIVGYGSIGRQMGRIAQSFGMDVLACKRNPLQKRDDSFCFPGTGDPEGEIPNAWFGESDMAEMFRRSDHVMIPLPHVPSTEKIICKTQLSALPKHAWLVSIGRGAVIDEPALIDMLKNGGIAGAGLDVFAEEPLPASSPLWDMPNVLIMPHVGSWTNRQADRATEVLIENIRRDLAGEPLVNVVDKKLRY